jgi:tetratricopeptide (TPR) repeat protein
MIPFVGREPERELLAAHWAGARAGQAQYVLVSGEAGIGKSRLIDEFAAVAKRKGAAVLRGRGWDLGQAPVLWPWIQAFGSHLDEVGADVVLPLLSDLDPAVVQLWPRLGGSLRVPEAHHVGSETAQLRLFDAMPSLLERLSAARSLIVLLDDLEAADPASLALLRFLARAGGRYAALVVALYRTPVPPDAASAPLLAHLERDTSLAHLALRGLAAPEIGLVLEGMTGRPMPGSIAAAVHERTGGNPLFASEFIRSLPLALDEAGQLAQLAGSPLPSGVRGVIEQRLGSLPARCRQLLEIGAVSGREFDVQIVAKVAGTTPEDLLAALAPAQAAAVVGPVAGRPLRLAFSHPLVRECLYQEIDVLARAGLPRDLGDTLRARHAAAIDEDLETLASHYIAALPVGAAALALEYCQLAARRSARVGARDEAVRLLELALEAVRALDDDGQRWCEVSLSLADALERAGRVPEARSMFLEVAGKAERLGLVRTVALAAVGFSGRLIWSRAVDPRELPLLERALAGLRESDLALRALLLSRLSMISRDYARLGDMVRGARQAVELALMAGDSAVLTRTRGALVFALGCGGTTEAALGAVDEYEHSARANDDLEHQVQAHFYRAMLMLAAGDLFAAQSEVALGIGINERLRQPIQRWLGCTIRAQVAQVRGQLDRAEEIGEEGRRLALDLQRPEGGLLHLINLYFVRHHQGRLAEIASSFTQAMLPLSQFAVGRVLVSHVAAMCDRPDEARGFLDRFLERGFLELLDAHGHRAVLALLTEMADRTGHTAAAAALEPLLATVSHRYLAANGLAWLGSAQRYRGLLAGLAGRRDQAAALLRDAARENRAVGSTFWALRCELDLARTLRAGDSAAGDEARALIDAVAEAAHAQGFAGLVAEAGKLVAAQSGATGRPGTPGRSEDLAFGLPEDRAEASFRREGEFWTIVFAGAQVRLRDSKGLRYLARLLAEQGRDFLALELMSTDSGVAEGAGGAQFDPASMGAPGDLGPVLDQQARAELSRRLTALEAELSAAVGPHDGARAEQLQRERDLLARELSAAVGLGGRERRVGGPAERARQSVTKAIKGALERIAREHQELGRHLGSTIRTGFYCRYEPDPRQPPSWRVRI